MSLTNKQRANRIKKVLDKHYISDWRVADVIADLIHLCDYFPEYTPYQKNDFDYEVATGKGYYKEEKSEEVA